ncbi:hypothetical protein JTE90_020290 [Oedothorax gibbosus]|uniref:E3 ubiquitin-protein ligase RNF144B n=1 Tax=Oedothorax gibbosus TaxID=931172 RepID=A0AAV6VQ84_9ARAC|nr:hypothetical protein JTE90_020290 [Oedothorax gibbosus]
MAPPLKSPDPKTKCCTDSKQKIFSFKWLLRKSKSSRSAKEMTQQQRPINVPASKSCDTGLTALETVDRCPSRILWKLLTPPGTGRKPECSSRNPKLPFRASFSCSDVHCLSSFPDLKNSESSQEVNCSLIKKQLASYKLSKSTASHLDGPSYNDGSDPTEERLVDGVCKLCLVKVPGLAMYTLQECGCSFCVPCLRQYLVISIREGHIPVTCPDAECPISGTILVKEIKEIAGDDAMSMFQHYKLNLDVALDPNRVWCPSPGCETVCSIQSISRPTMVSCHTCRLKFCSVCKLQWHGKFIACSEARKTASEEIELSSDEDCIKHCPNCHIPIEKEDGCAQMMCYRCRHVFCWHCLASLDDDFLLRHYDKGPCRNKLGHSRASIIWHRTQVVGIFAGFSLLLLLASPFLLLAAPCLLCCRCKCSRGDATPL